MIQMLKQIMLVCVCVFTVSGHVMADSLSDAQRASDMGDYAKAVKLLKPLAAKGNAVAQFKLAVLYYSGKGVAKNYKEAEKFYRLSAEQGHTVAQSNLATMYYSGVGTNQDFIMAHMWKSIAAAGADGERRLRYTEQLNALELNMTPIQIAEAQKLAKKCKVNKLKGCMKKRLIGNDIKTY